MSDWKKDLRDRIEDFREQEPEGLWSSIEAGLTPQKRTVPPLWWAALPAAAAVAALFLLPGTGVDIAPASRSSESIVEVIPHDNSAEVVPADSSASLMDLLETTENKRIVANLPIKKALKKRTGDTIPQEVVSVVREQEYSTQEVFVQDEVSSEQDVSIREDKASVSVADTEADSAVEPSENARQNASDMGRQKNTQPRETFKTPAIPPAKKYSPSRISVGVGHMKGAESASVSKGYGTTLFMAKRSAGQSTSDNYSMASLLTANQATTTEVRHSQPVRLGLSVSYAFTDRWSVESGIYRSTLETEFISGTSSVSTHTVQKLKCFGIPLHARYRLTPPSWLFSVTGVAGASWEKGYYLNQYQYGSIDGKMQDHDGKRDDNPNFMQFSTDVALDFELRLARSGWLAFFAEPGFSWYIPNGSEIRTVYGDKPFAPSLTMGARILIGRR